MTSDNQEANTIELKEILVNSGNTGILIGTVMPWWEFDLPFNWCQVLAGYSSHYHCC